MAFWNQGGSRDEPDDFDEYDPAPYGGGYDIALTYGRPVPQSEETCYPLSTFSSSGIDYDRPSYSSGSRPSLYEPEPDSDHDRYGHHSSFRPKPLPAYGFHPQGEQIRPKPDNYGDYGSGYSQPKPQYGSGYGGEYGSEYPHPKPQFGGGGDSQYGSEYWHPKPQHGSGYCGGGDSEYGSEYSRPKPEFGSGYGGGGGENVYGSVYPSPKTQFGSGYGCGSEYVSEYSQPKPKPQPHYGSGFGDGESEFGSGFGMRPVRKEEHSFGEEGVEEYDEYGRRKKSEGYGYGGSGYKKPYREEEGRYGGGITNYEAPSYGTLEEDRYQKPSHYGGSYEVEEYNPQKFEGNDSDDEEKKRHHHKHHHHHNYADE